jgi:hypothetical protein
MRSRWSASVAIALLASMLAIAAALAYQAQQAARSHRTTAENVLRDYAGFAAGEFSRIVRRDLIEAVGSALGHAASNCRDGVAPDLAHLKADSG